MDDEEKTDDEFEERFLQVFGLGDSETPSVAKTPVARTPSQPDPREREELLKRQAKNSPWLVCVRKNSPWLVCVRKTHHGWYVYVHVRAASKSVSKNVHCTITTVSALV